MSVHVLPSSRERDVHENLKAFIVRAKRSAAFGPLDWDAPVWKVKVVKSRRASAGRGDNPELHFKTRKRGERGVDDAKPFREPFASFAKALIRLREEASPAHVESHRVTIRACRYLHETLAPQGYDPCLLTTAHFDRVATKAIDDATASTAYATGKALVAVAKALDEHRIGRVRLDWKNKVPRPSSDGRHSKEAERRREEKLPSAAALDALPQIANRHLDDPDLLRMRTVELLVCGGWRINELLTIAANCEIEEPAMTDRGEPVLAPGGRQIVRYGIKYSAEKGFGSTIKWIPTPMVDVAKRAIADIRRITDPARADTAWMRRHPGYVNLSGLNGGDPNEWLKVVDIASSLGLKRNSGSRWCRDHNVETIKDDDGYSLLTRRGDVCAAILREMPRLPPRSQMGLEDHLFLVRDNFFHGRRSVIEGSVRFVVNQMIADFISAYQGRQNIFQRFGFTEPDGSTIHVTTHQFRHWLNTLAQEGGMSQELIARWSGRKDMSQNAAYDHVSGRKLAEKVREMIGDGRMQGPVGDVAERLPPVDRTTFLEAEVATAHTTEIGLCLHDWSMAPCPTHGDCANCDQHVVQKGDARQQAEAERQLAETEHILALGEREQSEGTYGATRWIEAHRRRRYGLAAVLDIHKDAGVPDGTLVHVMRSPAALGGGSSGPVRAYP
jgi:hypothetical protein